MPEHKFIDLQLPIKPNDGRLVCKTLYVKNIGDDVFIGSWAAASGLQGGAQFATYTDPRTWGVTFGRNFLIKHITKKRLFSSLFF